MCRQEGHRVFLETLRASALPAYTEGFRLDRPDQDACSEIRDREIQGTMEWSAGVRREAAVSMGCCRGSAGVKGCGAELPSKKTVPGRSLCPSWQTREGRGFSGRPNRRRSIDND